MFVDKSSCPIATTVALTLIIVGSLGGNFLLNVIEKAHCQSLGARAHQAEWLDPLVDIHKARGTLPARRRVEYSKPSDSLRNTNFMGGPKWNKKAAAEGSMRHKRALAADRRKIESAPNALIKVMKGLMMGGNRVNLNKNRSPPRFKTLFSHNGTATNGSGRPTQVPRARLESALDVPGVKCGKVPIYERKYARSINESTEVDPQTGELRILHGLDAVVGEWPWIVRVLECASDNETCISCTGTLLSDRWVITAGHCAFNRSQPDKFRATFGLYDLVTPDNSSFTVPVERLIVHPDYRDLNNDLTLMKLARPVKFDPQGYVRPACLVRPTRNIVEYAKGKRCYAVGYGLTDGMEDAIRLQKLEIRAKQASECNSYELGGSQLKPGTVCIGPPPGKMGSACKGDSGGPNVCYDPKAAAWSIIGTVSYGPPVCDRENGDKWLTVSVDLSNYRTWILSTILANS